MAGINFDFSSGVLPAGITFTRASIGTYVNAAGTLITAGNNVARFNYVAGVSNLLVEPAATNLTLQSNNLSTAPWALAGGATISGTQFVSPDGTNNGWALISSVTDGVVYQLYTYANALYTVSAWAKQISGPGIPQFKIATLASGPLAVSAVSARFSFSGTPAASSNTNAMQVIGGAGTAGIFGMQLETGPVATSYIPTTTAAVTRAADSATFTIPAGVTALQFTFDDGSKQVVAVTPGPYTIPTNLNRANIKSIQSAFVLDFTSGSLPAGVTLTRPSIGTYTSNTGLLTTASANAARFNYVSGVSCLLVEPAATNLALDSNNFGSANWFSTSGLVVTGAQFISPDGTNNGWTADSTAGAGTRRQTGLTISAAPYTCSVWAKTITGTAQTRFLFGNSNGNSLTTPASLTRIFDSITASAGADTNITVLTASCVNGWYGFQIEAGSKMTSYIPTTTAAVTRAADAATFTVPSDINLLTYTFDDNSTQAVPVSPGPYTVPTTLTRANIKSIVGTTVPPPNFDFTTGVLPAGITFTRGSIGTYTNAAGTLITVGNDVARFNYIAGVANLLIEGSATNLALQSNSFSTAPWGSVSGAVVTAAQFISPDGTNNGWSSTSGTGFGGPGQTSISFSAVPYTYSVWAKRITGTAGIVVYLPSANSGDLPTSTTLTRLVSTLTPTAGSGSANISINAASGSTDGLFGAQLETGSKATSYIPTTTTAATRAADSAVFAIPTGINQLVYTFDDNSTQTVAVSPGSYTIPTTLNRPNIKSVVGRYAFDFTSGSLPAGMTFTRPSIGTYVNNAGTLITAGNDVARFNYVSGVSNLLIEPSATNLITQSNNFTTTWTVGNGAAVTAAQFVGPDGTNTGWSLTSGTGNGYVQQATATTFLNIKYITSLWAKTIVGNSSMILYLGGSNDGPVTVTSTLTRLSQTATPPAGLGGLALWMTAASGGSTNGIYGVQIETGLIATSYIPTTTAAVTRAADAATFTIPTGVTQLTYTFDDNSTQTVSATPGSYTIPTTLNRPNIKSIAWISQAAITPTPSPARLGTFQSFGLAANIPLQLTAGGVYRLYILNTGPGNLFVSTGNTPGPNAATMLIPPLKAAPLTTTAGAIWLSSDQDSTVSIAAMPR